jgi:signal transduction histidine kinase
MVEQALLITQFKLKSRILETGRNIDIRTELGEIPPVLGRGMELCEVLVNLIFNAIDAMPEGGTILIRTYCLGEGVHVEVEDTGIGMTEEVRRRCTEPFF